MSSATDTTKFDAMMDAGWFQKNHLDPKGASFDGCMYETFGVEFEYVQAIARAQPGRVHTIVDCDGGSTVLCHGFHYVNRIGYLVSLCELVDFGDAMIDNGEPEEVYCARLVLEAHPEGTAGHEEAKQALKEARELCGIEEDES